MVKARQHLSPYNITKTAEAPTGSLLMKEQLLAYGKN
jgi:hypothetical protein